MGQLFQRGANAATRFILAGIVLGLGAIFYIAVQLNRSEYNRGEEVMKVQPVQFSHRHHVAELGIDCRYCHTSVQRSATAGIPPTQTCMTCHSQVWTDSPMLEPIRESWETGNPIKWQRVHDVPDFVYFNHSIHVNKGVGCETCHGRVDQMPLIAQKRSLQMQWCLECHRNPAKNLRPLEHIFTFGYEPEIPQEELGKQLVEEYNINSDLLDNCYTCHR